MSGSKTQFQLGDFFYVTLYLFTWIPRENHQNCYKIILIRLFYYYIAWITYECK